MSCSDILSICDQVSSGVPDVEINLFCSESQSSFEELWPEPMCPSFKHPPTIFNLIPQTPVRVVPPNSPVDLTRSQQQKTSNPFVNYLLRIWSEQTFNSPRIESVHQESGSLEDMVGPALIFEDHDAEHFGGEEEEASDSDDADYHIVPDFDHIVPDITNPPSSQDTSEYEDDYDSQRSRILNSCVSTDHTVPVAFLEE